MTLPRAARCDDGRKLSVAAFLWEFAVTAMQPAARNYTRAPCAPPTTLISRSRDEAASPEEAVKK
ncbi:hypothetical protein GCM10010244_42440 [Streptomyces coeruleorubidus]|nr:hypothetical protein GCM10010244_42440 [Streptomyces bellus]